MRLLAQQDALPDVDPRSPTASETRVSLALVGDRGASRAARSTPTCGCAGASRRLHRDRAAGKGEREAVARRRALAVRVLRGGGAVSLGARPGRAWYAGRYEGPYLRDELLDLGYMVETLETAHTWSRLDELYEAVRDAIGARARGRRARRGSSSATSRTRTGTARRCTSPCSPGARRARRSSSGGRSRRRPARRSSPRGGTITHHHAVGRDHAPYMRAEVGELGLEVLRAVKERLDPAGIMNPGKLLG